MKIYFITSNNDFFGQTRKAWVSMNSELIKKRLIENGYEVEKITHHFALNNLNNINNSAIFYGFSQKINIRQYLLDLVRYLDNGTNLLIPSYDLLKCHENKGYQELFKIRAGISGLKAYYLTSINDLPQYSFEFPLVFKTTDGSNGKGVKLVKSHEELIAALADYSKINFWDKLDIFRRKYFRKEKKYKEYPNYSNKQDLLDYIPYITNESNFILQEFIPNLEFDFRVLAIYDKYFIMKRHTKKGDFRASGTKLFDFNNNYDENLLNYCSDIRKKIDSPFLSMDVGFHNGKYHLFEFQALHFGVGVYMQSEIYYYLKNNEWQSSEYEKNIEYDLADGLTKYIHEKVNERKV